MLFSGTESAFLLSVTQAARLLRLLMLLPSARHQDAIEELTAYRYTRLPATTRSAWKPSVTVRDREVRSLSFLHGPDGPEIED